MIEQFTKDDLLCLIQNGTGDKYSYGYVSAMATQLLAEMDKPSVWDGAPEDATKAIIQFDAPSDSGNICIATYTRELQKNRARQIAEECFKKASSVKTDAEAIAEIEQAILKYAEAIR